MLHKKLQQKVLSSRIDTEVEDVSTTFNRIMPNNDHHKNHDDSASLSSQSNTEFNINALTVQTDNYGAGSLMDPAKLL